ncbi:NADP-aldehyde dehydrogenase [Flammula alnicola]|nr:NADP-aldehyde dehydrogenase [Flammula alnicola]
MTDYTPLDDIPRIHDALRKKFRTGITKPLKWRRHQLLQLARFAKENEDALVECIRQDLGRAKQETVMSEVTPIVERSLICAEKLEEWTKPEEVTVQAWQQGWNPTVHKHPKGVVLIMAPWNYPMILSLQPLYGAIAAGCCAVIKPSEIAPHYASFLARTLPKYLDSSVYSVVLGGIPESTKVLELKWDHIFYTGNGRVARIISAAAAKHLTPLTLELGGKSPVIVDSTADISVAAKRILWGKINNCGQLCVTPDFVLAEKSIMPALVEAFAAHLKTFYPEGAHESKSYGRIVSDEHFKRLKGLLSNTKGRIAAGGKLVQGERFMEPTVVVDFIEIFGPILPIVSVENVDEAIDYVNDQCDHPLVLYAFTTEEKTKKKILDNTTSGNVLFNDTINMLSMNEVPFGGVGESGYGRQVLYYSFENFTYTRSVADMPYPEEKFFGPRYPPYTKESLEFMSEILRRPIPESVLPSASL